MWRICKQKNNNSLEKGLKMVLCNGNPYTQSGFKGVVCFFYVQTTDAQWRLKSSKLNTADKAALTVVKIGDIFLKYSAHAMWFGLVSGQHLWQLSRLAWKHNLSAIHIGRNQNNIAWVLHLKQIFPPIIWIFTEGEGDGIESRLPFKIFSTNSTLILKQRNWV